MRLPRSLRHLPLVKRQVKLGRRLVPLPAERAASRAQQALARRADEVSAGDEDAVDRLAEADLARETVGDLLQSLVRPVLRITHQRDLLLHRPQLVLQPHVRLHQLLLLQRHRQVHPRQQRRHRADQVFVFARAPAPPPLTLSLLLGVSPPAGEGSSLSARPKLRIEWLAQRAGGRASAPPPRATTTTTTTTTTTKSTLRIEVALKAVDL
mmetsp:Transcript_22436/g.43640  ORF Transcript_22436/g.43640 Transcript_22436/m.43640 type:complete len:210 (-) Transcript_22436:487-1116(-)